MWVPAPSLTGASWRTSSYTSGANNCVEVADFPTVAAVRDSKNPTGPALLFARREWASFVRTVQGGRLDLG
ncbi:protein of unknown function (DUF397) [Streptoalloteichus tenebrarius]|uniref:DUF397 domain-containing protein n=1 Tax=Streptoalloteichus tenebrarius (strain ATCC 17920 / DSM 40477 / JCM 4838 / CBS 697.72 / NBRC 16177 / NCIMB 11028 / NRRL B-12390 / A12253. 1 / ISP 5477) TaxID=1933 RepID=A0ABT1HQQ1_STRSD|nr:DUF397 domain-containing protein [Streptoalloteichus tenebrarius]MCP2257836.1 protein of unknown function (DUF397) [Streptoalloteichus tenebrarius]BFE99802.1 DUF397 domain-containing protein [Streptoalloteichus tenebrarius]